MVRIWVVMTALFISLAMPASADVSGRIEGLLAEEDRVWQLLREPGAGATGTFSRLFPGQTSFQLQGHVGETFSVTEALIITFTQADDGTVSEPGVQFLPTRVVDTYYEAGADDLTITITEQTETGEEITITGTATGTMVLTERSGTIIETRPDDTLAFDLTFSAVLLRDD